MDVVTRATQLHKPSTPVGGMPPRSRAWECVIVDYSPKTPPGIEAMPLGGGADLEVLVGTLLSQTLLRKALVSQHKPTVQRCNTQNPEPGEASLGQPPPSRSLRAQQVPGTETPRTWMTKIATLGVLTGVPSFSHFLFSCFISGSR